MHDHAWCVMGFVRGCWCPTLAFAVLRCCTPEESRFLLYAHGSPRVVVPYHRNMGTIRPSETWMRVKNAGSEQKFLGTKSNPECPLAHRTIYLLLGQRHLNQISYCGWDPPERGIESEKDLNLIELKKIGTHCSCEWGHSDVIATASQGGYRQEISCVLSSVPPLQTRRDTTEPSFRCIVWEVEVFSQDEVLRNTTCSMG